MKTSGELALDILRSYVTAASRHDGSLLEGLAIAQNPIEQLLVEETSAGTIVFLRGARVSAAALVHDLEELIGGIRSARLPPCEEAAAVETLYLSVKSFLDEAAAEGKLIFFEP